jgi:hypothetical protein
VNKIFLTKKNGEEIRVFPLRFVRLTVEETPGIAKGIVRYRLRTALADSEIPNSRKLSKEIIDRAIEYRLVRLTSFGNLYPVDKEDQE